VQETEERFTHCDVLDYAEVFLSRRFPHNIAKCGKMNVPAYEWLGAGSEKSGSSGHLMFNKMIFVPIENESDFLAISVGRRPGQRDHSYPTIMYEVGSLEAPYTSKMSGLFRVILPGDLVKPILQRYDSSRHDSESGFNSSRNKIQRTIAEIIRSNNRRYGGISLFAFDGEFEGLRRGFSAKLRAPLSGESLRSVLVGFPRVVREVYPNVYFRCNNEERIDLANRLANRLAMPENFVDGDEIGCPFPSSHLDEDSFKGEQLRYLLHLLNGE
tara:strand:- start:57 stop:869 length:813 start_codon:yes stop_codon:yes gene_type:complete